MPSDTRPVSPPQGQHGSLQGDLRTANGDKYPCREKLRVVTLHTTYRGATTETPGEHDQYAELQIPPSFFVPLPEDRTRRERNVEIMQVSSQSPVKAEHKHLARINARSFKRTTFHYKFSVWLLLGETEQTVFFFLHAALPL